MCGRARLETDYTEIKIRSRFASGASAPNLRPSWNIAPTQDMLVAVRDPDTGTRQPAVMRWGLIPSWSKEAKMKGATFNAKAETVDRLPTFRGAWKADRRLVVTDGYYEWREPDGQPFTISRKDGRLTVMAGLWEAWKGAGEVVRSCTVITTSANALQAQLHDRMPVILNERDWPAWLGEETAAPDRLKALLRPCPPEDLVMWPVSRRVGNVRNNDRTLVEPVTSPSQQG